MNLTINHSDPLSMSDWCALPDDIKAGIFEEIEELHEQGTAEQHWAWTFVQPFLEYE